MTARTRTPAPTVDELNAELGRRRSRSAAMYEQACQVIPSGTVSRARLLPPFPFFAAAGRGARLIDVDGTEYIDCTLGFGSQLLGHAHPVVVKAIQDSATDGTS